MEQNKLRCSWCQYHIHEGIGYKPCPNLDHDKIQLRPQVFNGYSGAYDSCEICLHYKSAKWIKNPTFTNIEDYIEFLDKEWYEPSNYQKAISISNLKQFRYVSIRIPSEDLEIEVPLIHWLKGTWKEGSKIRYKKISRLIKNKKGEYYKMELIDTVDIKTDEVYHGEFKWYELKDK